MLAGCRGCAWTGAQSTAQKKSAEEKKRDEQKMRLVVRELAAHPSADGQTINTLKPGHWYQGKQEIKANQSDESLDVTTEIVDRKLEPIPIRGSSVFLRFKREAVLAKGQTKSPEILFYVPEMPAEVDENNVPVKPTVRMLYSQRGLGAH